MWRKWNKIKRKEKDSPDHLNPSVNSLLNWKPRQVTPQGFEFCDYEWKLHCLFLSALLLFCPLILDILALTASRNKKISSKLSGPKSDVSLAKRKKWDALPSFLRVDSFYVITKTILMDWGHITTNFLLITLLFIFSKYTKAYDQMHPQMLLLTC